MGLQVTAAADGSAFTSQVTIYITKDGTQALGTVGSGLMTHAGNGFHTYLPSASETNATHLAWCGTGSGAIPSCVQTYTDGDISVIDYGTAQSAGAASLVLAAAASFADGELDGATIIILSATAGAKQSRMISTNVGDTVTVDPPWTTTPTGTIVYGVFATPPSATTALPGVNLKQVNDLDIDGAGTTGDPWGPA